MDVSPAASQEPGARSQEPGARSQEPGAKEPLPVESWDMSVYLRGTAVERLDKSSLKTWLVRGRQELLRQ